MFNDTILLQTFTQLSAIIGNSYRSLYYLKTLTNKISLKHAIDS